MRQRGSTLLEFALAWPVVLLLALGAVQLAVWVSEVYAVRAAAAAGARAGSAVGAGPVTAEQVTLAVLRPSLSGTRAEVGCARQPSPNPAGIRVCVIRSPAEVRVRVAGKVPTVVPVLAQALPVAADVAVAVEAFQ